MTHTVILGASRGLGAALAKHAAQTHAIHGFARKEDKLKEIATTHQIFTYTKADFTKPEDQHKTIEHILATKPEKVFVVAGGGPYGTYHTRNWKDHEWALTLSLMFPAKLLHALSGQPRKPQTILIGSAIAESQADPQAAAYAAAKHALKGLHHTLTQEYPDWDLRLFSPGYIDTDMLPPNAPPRLKPIYKPETLAKELWDWSFTPDKAGHRVYPPHPNC